MLNWPSRVGFWLRVAAGAIDLVMMLVAYAIVAIAMAALFAIDDERTWSVVWYAIIVGWLTCEIFWAGTPGKLILRLRIANANGTPASRAVRFHRWITKTWCFWLGIFGLLLANHGIEVFSGIAYGMLIIGCFGAANDYRQTWHDEVAHTAVFRRRDIYGDPSPASGFDAIPPPIPREPS